MDIVVVQHAQQLVLTHVFQIVVVFAHQCVQMSVQKHVRLNVIAAVVQIVHQIALPNADKSAMEHVKQLAQVLVKLDA